MSDTIFKETSLGWQIKLLQQRAGEWWEYQSSRIADNAPNIPLIDLDAAWIRFLVRVLLWSLTAAILVWVTWQLWLFIRPNVRTWRKQQQRSKQTASPPISQELSVNQWLEQAQDFQKQRDYRQAIFCLYQAMLQRLSDREIIPSSLSRTDREYLRLIQNSQITPLQSYQLLLNTHEKLCFTNQDADESLWQACKQAFQSSVISSATPHR